LKLKYNFFIVIGFLFVSHIAICQGVISGKMTTINNTPIQRASITVTDEEDTIITYTFSDNNGNYTLDIQSELLEVNLDIQNLGFKSIKRKIKNVTQKIDFTLIEEEIALEEVLLRAPPITKKGDTINYAVSQFTQEQDRSIADVLKRLPGIEVQDNGRILYEGKAINKFYIEGLDLLGGNYNLANKNLPHKEVTKVQVLENHQPIKILDSLVFSDRAAINIKLKNKYTFTGQAITGLGVPATLWSANVTPILITPKEQLLATYQSNNAGDNIGRQLHNHLSVGNPDVQNAIQKTQWLGIQQVNPPNFSAKRWLDNRTHIGAANYLKKLSYDYDFRINASYINDDQSREGATNTLFFIANDTIALLEQNNNKLFTSRLNTNVKIEKNTTNNYFQNNTRFEGVWDSQRSQIVNSNGEITESHKDRFFRVQNHLKSLFTINNLLLTLESDIVFDKAPPSLRVTPGSFESLLNNGAPFDGLLQEVDQSAFYTYNTLKFTKGWKGFAFSPIAGFFIENQDLDSKLSLPDNGDLPVTFSNHLDWFHTKSFFSLNTRFKKGDWHFFVSTPINYYLYDIVDNELDESQEINQVTFEPTITVNYEFDKYWKLNTSASWSNQFGKLQESYFGYILQNYRFLRRNDAIFPQIKNQSQTVGLSYRNPLKAWFWNLNYTRLQGDSNVLYSNEILDNGAIEFNNLEIDNTTLSNSISTRINHYFDALNTNIVLTGNYGVRSNDQIINDEVVEISNQNWGFGVKTQVEFTDWLNVEYRGNWRFIRNEIAEVPNDNIVQQNHFFDATINLSTRSSIIMQSEYIRNNLLSDTSSNFFGDMTFRYSLKKKNIDFELKANNIFNTTNYRNVFVNDFTYLESSFRLRPRQLLFNVRFSL